MSIAAGDWASRLGGVTLVAFFDKKEGPKDSIQGDVLAIVSAIGYGMYSAFLKVRIKDEKQVKMAIFFGFVGLWNLLLLWPFFFLLHFTGLEPFTLPSLSVFGYLSLNGLLGTVLSDFLWSLVIFLTSATVATIGLSLSVPFSLLLDLIIKKRHFPGPYYVGAGIVLVGFVAANLGH